MSDAVSINSDKNISSDEDKDVRRGNVNSNTNNIVYESTKSSYESPSKDKHHQSIIKSKASSELLLEKHHQKKRKVVPQTGCWDILLKTKRRYNS